MRMRKILKDFWALSWGFVGSCQRILNIGGHIIRFSCKADDLDAVCKSMD